MGLAATQEVDQPRYKTWEHGRKPDAEGKGNSPWFHAEPLLMRMLSINAVRLWNREGWRAVCAETCKHGSGRGTRHTRKGQRSLLYQWLGPSFTGVERRYGPAETIVVIGNIAVALPIGLGMQAIWERSDE